MKYMQLADKRVRVYSLVSTWMVACAIFHVYFVSAVFSNTIAWLPYYAANYEFGFVRRGLAGELLRIFPDEHYLTANYVALWTSSAIWLTALAVLMWLILYTGTRSERRIMLALIVPVLVFSFSYALYNPHTEIYGMTVLLAFGIALRAVRTARSKIMISTLYGIAMAVLALVHEAIPLEFALGALLAIVVLSKDAARRPQSQRICSVLAVGPGIVSTILVATLGRRGVGDQLCEQVPHGMVEDSLAASQTPQETLSYLAGRITGSVEHKVDYHDWVCLHIAPQFDWDLADGFRWVMHFGFFSLLGAFVVGLVFFAVTIWIIRILSGVRVSAFLNEIRGNLVLYVLGLALLVPVFATAVDWTRWWTMITVDVAIVYILFAIDRPEIEQAPSRSDVRIFVAAAVVLAAVPSGAGDNVGGQFRMDGKHVASATLRDAMAGIVLGREARSGVLLR